MDRVRSRAAFLPYPGDPFLFHYWLKFFDNIWGNEVDRLYVYLNSPIELEVVDYISALCLARPKIVFRYVDHQVEHGEVLNRMLEICEEEYIMLIEDDGYIFKPGVVDGYFKLLEDDHFTVIGSPRGSCSQEILDEAQKKWNLDYSGMGDVGPNFWPNFFFTKKNILLATDRNFGARAWKKGEPIVPLGVIAQEDPSAADTFVNTSLQIRAMVPIEKILTIPQYHASPDDMEHHKNGQFLFDGRAPWTHVGSLSSGVGGVLIDDYGRPLARRSIDPRKDIVRVPGQCTTDQERSEWERRVTFWSLFLDYAEVDKIQFFQEEYRKALRRIIAQFELPEIRIEQKKAIYRSLGL